MQITDLFWLPVNWLSANVVALFQAVTVLVICWYLSKFLYRTIKNLLPQAYGVDKNFAPLLAQAARYGTIIFGIITALSFVGVSSASIYAVVAAAGLAVALALQGTLSNIAAGIMLIWLRPIAIGEYITGDGVAGVVVEIGLFGTRLRSTSGLYIFTPNTKLWNSAITNHSR
jgi:small conductance mechanosensitive channel